MIAALFVATNGVYFNLPGVVPWDKEKDARRYFGPWPVVAHPPCERCGRYWSGGPSAKVWRKRGDDSGCFEAALRSVRTWGGILEHPADSSAWEVFGLMYPPRSGGWVVADWDGGWTCCVEQGHYGHRARKATWLYANRTALPILTWGASGRRARMDLGLHSAAERRAFMSNRTLSPELTAKKPAYLDALETETGMKLFKRLSAVERLKTPVLFRNLLLSIAQSAHSMRAA